MELNNTPNFSSGRSILSEPLLSNNLVGSYFFSALVIFAKILVFGLFTFLINISVDHLPDATSKEFQTAAKLRKSFRESFSISFNFAKLVFLSRNSYFFQFSIVSRTFSDSFIVKEADTLRYKNQPFHSFENQYKEVLLLLGKKIPTYKIVLYVCCIYQFWRQILHRIGIGIFLEKLILKLKKTQPDHLDIGKNFLLNFPPTKNFSRNFFTSFFKRNF
jgi:hypothetical protein